jgi:hypothetical protein
MAEEERVRQITCIHQPQTQQIKAPAMNKPQQIGIDKNITTSNLTSPKRYASTLPKSPHSASQSTVPFYSCCHLLFYINSNYFLFSVNCSLGTTVSVRPMLSSSYNSYFITLGYYTSTLTVSVFNPYSKLFNTNDSISIK